jgi:two-component system, cell cycle response regulator DivK
LALYATRAWPIYVASVLIAKVTLERRRDHLIALALLRRGIAREAVRAQLGDREFAIMSADDIDASIRWILLVEDHPTCAKLTRRVLESEGYAVVVAESAADAVWQLEISPPDVVLLDLKLPDRDGLSLLRDLRADPRTRDLPVVALTALSMVGDRERGLDAGCNDYLTKPLDAAQLRAALARCMPNAA